MSQMEVSSKIETDLLNRQRFKNFNKFKDFIALNISDNLTLGKIFPRFILDNFYPN